MTRCLVLRDNIKWICVNTFGSYQYIECYDKNASLKTVDLFKDEKSYPANYTLKTLIEKITYREKIYIRS